MSPADRRANPGISPLLSSRAELGGRLTTREDDYAVIIAVLMRHAAAAPGSDRSRRSIAFACRCVKRMLTPAELKEGAGFDEPGRMTPARLIRAAADHAARVLGNVALANNILESLSVLVPPDSLEGGRVLSQRGATSWFLGANELAAAQYRQLHALGRRLGERELIARATHGISAVRMSAGNFPAAERLTRQTIRLAGAEFPRVAAGALVQLAIIRSVRGDYDGALGHAWRAFHLAKGSELGRQTVLANIAQILLDAGYPAAARVASSHALRLPRLRTPAFAHLSTYAAASAALNDGKAVDWVAAELLRLAKPPFFAQYAADALLDCSFSLEQMGRIKKAKQLRARAHEIATRHGYHDIAWMAEHDLRRGKPRAPKPITRATEAIVSEIRALEPAHVSLHGHAG